MKTVFKYILSLILSVVIIWFLYRNVDFDTLIPLIRNIHTGYFCIFILLILIQLGIASYRWRAILAIYGNERFSGYKSAQYVIGSYAANLIIPAKMGEFVRIAWAKNTEQRKSTFRLVVFEKVMDITAVYGIYALALLFVLHTQERFILFVITVVLPCSLLALVAKTSLNSNVRRYMPGKLKDFLVFYRDRVSIKSPGFIKISAISLFLWLIQVLQFYFIFLAFSIQLGIIESFAGNAFAVLAGAFIPSIGGIGPRDAAIIWFFKSAANSLPLTAIGTLSAIRVVLPALIGLPMFFNLTRKM